MTNTQDTAVARLLKILNDYEEKNQRWNDRHRKFTESIRSDFAKHFKSTPPIQVFIPTVYAEDGDNRELFPRWDKKQDAWAFWIVFATSGLEKDTLAFRFLFIEKSENVFFVWAGRSERDNPCVVDTTDRTSVGAFLEYLEKKIGEMMSPPLPVK